MQGHVKGLTCYGRYCLEEGSIGSKFRLMELVLLRLIVALKDARIESNWLCSKRYLLTKDKYSLRVLALVLKMPSMQEVVITEFCFSTPRIIMHICLASIVTAAPAA